MRLIFYIFLIPCFLFATNYTVGSGETYTQLTAVAGLVNPGDTVFVTGNQSYNAVQFTRAGTEANPIVVLGVDASGVAPTISGGTNAVHFSSSSPYTSGADWYVFENFIVTGSSYRGIYLQAGDLIIRDCVIQGNTYHGILGGDEGTGNCTIEHCNIYGNGSGTQYHQVYVSTDQTNRPGSKVRFQFNWIHDGNGGNAYKSRAERNELYYNLFQDATYREIELLGCEPGVHDPWLAREDGELVGNVIISTNSSAMRLGGDGTGESSGRYRLIANTIINNGSGAAIWLFDSVGTVEAYNNIFYDESGTLDFIDDGDVIWAYGSAQITGSNNWVSSSATDVPASLEVTAAYLDPNFTNYAGENFSLDWDSRAIHNAKLTTPTNATYPMSGSYLSHPAYNAVTTASLAAVARGHADIGAMESSWRVGSHPRIWLTEEKIAQLKANRTANTAEWQRLDARCQAYWSWTGAEIIADYIAQYDYMLHYAMGHYAGAGAGYMSRAVDILVAFVNGTDATTTIAYDSDYRSRSYLVSMAAAYDLCYDSLTTGQRTLVADRIKAWATHVAANGYARYGSLYYEPGNNYAAGHMNGMLFSALALWESDSATVATHRTTALAALADMEDFMTTRLNSGDANEGWSYGAGTTQNWFYAMGGLKTAEMTDYFSGFEFEENIMKVMYYFVTPDKDFILANGDWARESTGLIYSNHRSVVDMISTYSDDETTQRLAMEWAEDKYPVADVHNFYVWNPFLFHNMDLDAIDYTVTQPYQDTLYYFTDSSSTGQFVARTGWGSTDTWVNFRAGGMYGDHAHNGNGHFEISKNGRLVIDDNVWDYDGTQIGDYSHNCVQFPTVSDTWNLPSLDYYMAEHAAIPYRDFTANYYYIWENSTNVYAYQGDNTSTKAERRFLYIPEADIVWTFDIANTTSSTTDVEYREHYNSAVTASGGDWYYSNGTSRINTHCAYPSAHSGSITSGASGRTNNQLNITQTSASTDHYFVVANYINSAFLTQQDIAITDGYGSAIVKADTTYLAMFTDGLTGNIQFTHDDNVKTKYFIDGINPGTTYYVTNTDNGSTRTITVSTSAGGDFEAASSSQAMLYFTSDGESSPPVDPPAEGNGNGIMSGNGNGVMSGSGSAIIR